MESSKKKRRKKKTSRRIRPEKSYVTPRQAERMMKNKSLADYIDKASDPGPDEFNTFAQENLVCPYCGQPHEAEDLNIRKQTQGSVKCGNCGEIFDFEVVKKITFTTFPEKGK